MGLSFSKHILYVGFIGVVLLISGCSSKQEYVVDDSQIDSFYKHSSNSNIRNSKAVHKATLRPYEVFGERYYPKIEEVGDSFEGIASWYGPNFHAKKTSNGETYNMHAMTAAHKTLPMNTMLRVVNLENGKSAIVRVNDRGPFVDDRIIDLSNKAAHKIDMFRKGTAPVRITVLGYNGQIENKNAPYNQMPKKEKIVKAIKNFDIKEKTYEVSSYNIQVGAFSRYEGAVITKDKFSKKINFKKKIKIKKVTKNSRTLYKVLIVGFKSFNLAQNFKNINELDSSVVIRDK
ncbi:MAG: septal ring lytic transglycosylase RlpA family protein [Arcobacter sp.]|nr:septal ring lytic transglycosylase RlpA family protein [Arcobacter sp.]